ncbi:uncharacterized protein BO66DRAFT_56172 [Aspergillus aculeatinus CBS 121060]|uniref:Uncharacterized protein n=1 Tax=Aspergillus aculeatinus CBS 121060 TaxID=1448322 RepID=A0ACD1HD59_9EURO|nr:hypothetical protein BO66DRAFT_56172 [Aspergillus aculeatinus CBS 121060]RAH71350.1 hypothetical protein BO66DRAFT_56172 [Aspergillus aculeatinus CBS 121060]
MSTNDVIKKSSESTLGRNLQHTYCFRLNEQQPRQVTDSNTPIPNNQVLSISDAYGSDDTPESVTASGISPAITTARLFEVPNQSYGHIANQLSNGFSSHNGQSLNDIENIVNVYDMIQPILPVQAFHSFSEQDRGSMGNMVNVHDMLQPIVPTQDYGSIRGDVHHEPFLQLSYGRSIILTQNFTYYIRPSRTSPLHHDTNYRR